MATTNDVKINPIKVYKCQHCENVFTTSSSLTIHMRRHTGDYKSSTKQGLQYHQRTHTKERPFACQHCDLRFTNSSSLTIHMCTAHKQVLQDYLRTHLPIKTPQFDITKSSNNLIFDRTYTFSVVEVQEEDLE